MTPNPPRPTPAPAPVPDATQAGGTTAPPSASAAPAPGTDRRETRGLVTVAAGAAVLCVLTAIGYNVLVTRELKSPAPVLQAPGSGTAGTAAPAAGAAAPAPGSGAGAGAGADSGSGSGAAAPAGAPPTPQAAAGEPEAGSAAGAAAGTGAGTGGGAGPGTPATSAAGGGKVSFAPPDVRQIPPGPMGDVIRRGQDIFLRTGANAPGFVGNALNCVNCHLDAGRQPKSAPMWGAYPLYPAYRSKTKHVDTFADRLRGCFTYSMNGKAPPAGHEVLVALEAYAYWMAQGAPVGSKLDGAGYGKLPAPAKVADHARGAAVYTAQCALCHGADGQGQRSGQVQVFPPLWGASSYNWGAGMHEVDKAAAFIQANMPLGRGGSLSAQEAWDVALYINSHERPQDPRFVTSVAATRAQFHDSPYSLYGTSVNGKLLGSGT